MDDFRVETNGFCFLCLDKTPSLRGPGEKPEQLSHTVHSLQYLSRYLKVDMRRVFDDKGPVPPDLLAKVKRARLKVELCKECSSLNETFSKLYRQLEKIEMEVASNLSRMHEKMLEAEKTGKLEKLLSLTNSEKRIAHENTGKLKIAKVLRIETMEKCFYKTDMTTAAIPRAKIQNWSAMELNAEINKIKSMALTHRQRQNLPIVEETTEVSNTLTPEMFKTGFKEEDSNSDPNLLTNDNGSEYFDDNDDDHDYNMQNETSELPRQAQAAATTSSKADTVLYTPEADIKNSQIDESNCKKEEGRFKCRLCSQTFSTKSVWKGHYINIHLKVKYKCNLCGAEFAKRCNYNRHHQNIHMGVKFKCLVCNKMFTLKGNLTQHQKKSSCKMGTFQIPL